MWRSGEEAQVGSLGPRLRRVVAPEPPTEPTADRLTGLATGNRLRERLDQALDQCAAGDRVGVLRCEVDGLSTVNRCHGGAAGDALLRTVAQRLRTLLHPADLAARVGGDDFAVLLGHLGSDTDPYALLNLFARRLRAPLELPDAVLSPTVSLGLAVADPCGGSPVDAPALLSLAAEMVRRGRAAGRPVLALETDVEAEAARVAALRAYDVHDPALDDALRAMAEVAAVACDTLYAFVTFVDTDLQWVRAASGVGVPGNPDTCAPRHLALCDHTIRQRGVLVIPDTHADPRYHRSRHASWQLDTRFYAGAPLLTPEGRAIGSLCVVDTVPGTLSERRRRSLAVLADEIMAILETYRAGRDSLSF